MNRTAVVVPTIREEHIGRFIGEWLPEFELQGADLLVMEDHPTRQFALPVKSEHLQHFSHEDAKRDLGDDAWIIPQKTSACRAYAFWKAYQQGYETIITLDDDTRPIGRTEFVREHVSALGKKATLRWKPSTDLYARGFPYGLRDATEIVLNHGLWQGVPDLDAPTQLVTPMTAYVPPSDSVTIPYGNYFPMCIMNVGFKRMVTPAMYMLLMGANFAYSRFDDIWAGVMVKKICDHLGFAVRSGSPVVLHERASNVFSNLKAEAAGIEMNETFWQYVDKVVLTKTTFKECYLELVEKLDLHGEYWDVLKRAMRIWGELF